MKRALVMIGAVLGFWMVARTQATLIGTTVNVNPGAGGNTVRNSDGLNGVAGGWLGAADGQWDNRTNTIAAASQIGGDVLENQSTAVSSPELKLTVTGMNSSVVNKLYVIYWTQDATAGGSAAPGEDWHINAGLSAGSLTTYNSANGTYTGTSVPVPATSKFVSQREAFLGQVTGVSSASIFVTGDLFGGVDNRTWFDAVAFEAVPEPSTLLLLLAGGLTVWRCARRR